MNSDIRIADLLKHKRPLRSVEFFPPKDSEGVQGLMKIATALKVIGADFVSVTYGAGGTTRERSLEVCRLLKNELGYTVMPHLTCVGSTQDELLQILSHFYDQGIRNIMALRGDPPQGQTVFQKTEHGFSHASELVALIKQNFPDISIGVAGYPEKHPEATDLDTDLKHLKHKVEQGADFITTQLFFQNSVFFDFEKRCKALGISIPIVAGIMPVLSYKQIQRFTQLCGSSLPAELSQQLEPVAEDNEAVESIGVAWAWKQVQELTQNNVAGVHWYVLNRDRAALRMAQQLSQV